MDQYFLDRETLGKFVDELMQKKTLPADSVADLNSIREKAIEALDKKIENAVLGSLNEEQLAELNALLDKEETPEEDFRNLFKRAGVDVSKVMTNVMLEFGKDFLGGKNV